MYKYEYIYKVTRAVLKPIEIAASVPVLCISFSVNFSMICPRRTLIITIIMQEGSSLIIVWNIVDSELLSASWCN